MIVITFLNNPSSNSSPTSKTTQTMSNASTTDTNRLPIHVEEGEQNPPLSQTTFATARQVEAVLSPSGIYVDEEGEQNHRSPNETYATADYDDNKGNADSTPPSISHAHWPSLHSLSSHMDLITWGSIFPLSLRFNSIGLTLPSLGPHFAKTTFPSL